MTRKDFVALAKIARDMRPRMEPEAYDRLVAKLEMFCCDRAGSFDSRRFRDDCYNDD
jgi:hypothetical protein